MLISYAQNFEDVILWRALKDVDDGFYIDIGAQDPVIDSVSLAFYEKGWRGVHVEPTAGYAEKLRHARPDETVIQAAIGTSADSIAFWEFPATGLSTGNPDIAAMHQEDNRKAVRVELPCMRLSSLLSDYHNRDIHWLKIDAEGMEHAVIQSWQPAKARPWIVVVESTRPNSQEPTFTEWEPLLVKLGYEFVYFDGLNRFYVSCEKPELKKHFGPGPNYFDGFALNGTTPYCARINAETAHSREQAAALHHELAAKNEKLSRAAQAFAANDAWARSLEADVIAKNATLAAIYASTTWRITAPLRSASGAALWVLRGLRAWLMLWPGSRLRRLRMMLSPADAPQAPIQDFVQRNAEIVSDLSPSVRRVYGELKAAIAQHEAGC